MPEILKPGLVPQKPVPWPIGQKFTCAACGCEWKIETVHDYLSVISSDSRHRRAITAPCPTCNARTLVDDERVTT